MSSVGPIAGDVVRAERARSADRRYEMAKLAYSEVLDATKHQDDKVGRVLTAVAFLTAGSVALLTQQSVTEYRFQVGEHSVPLVALLAGLFLGCVALAVLLLLLSVSSRLRLPPGRSRTARTPSRIYFNVIADTKLEDWQARWTGDTDVLTDEITNNFVDESHGLSERLRVKYGRSDEAVSVFVLGLLFLVTSATCYVAGVSHVQATGQNAAKPGEFTLDLSVYVRLALAFAVGAHAASQIYAVLRNKQQEVDLDDAGTLGRVQQLRGVVLAALMYPFAVLLPLSGGAHDPGRIASGWVGTACSVAFVGVTGLLLREAADVPDDSLADRSTTEGPASKPWRAYRDSRRRRIGVACCWIAAVAAAAVDVAVECPCLPTSGPAARLAASLVLPLGVAIYSVRLPSSRLRVEVANHVAWHNEVVSRIAKVKAAEKKASEEKAAADVTGQKPPA